MLMTIMSLTSLMILPKLTKLYWHIITAWLLMMSLFLFTLMFNPWSLISSSQNMMMDTMSSSLSILSMWILTLMFVASYKILNTNNLPKLFMFTCIILLISLMFSFNASSLILFYMSFEASLIPTMMLIMLWGYQPERLQASTYLIIYTVTASLPLLIMILKIMNETKHLNMTMAQSFSSISFMDQTPYWLMMITAFLVKLPMFIVHLWLPKAHVEAPVAGSMILAAILLKLGSYGLARMLMMFEAMNKLLSTPIMVISLIGGVTTSMICLRQSDMKSLIAYSSVGHMGLMVAAMMTGSKLGMQASLTMMLAHGLSSSALFCMANITYAMTNTRSVTLTKGLLVIMPALSMWWFMFCCANMAAPPSINLLSEIFLITSSMSYSMMNTLPLSLISFITVAYSLYLYATINHGSSSSQFNPMYYLPTSDMMLMLLHLVPTIMLITKTELIISWC